MKMKPVLIAFTLFTFSYMPSLHAAEPVGPCGQEPIVRKLLAQFDSLQLRDQAAALKPLFSPLEYAYAKNVAYPSGSIVEILLGHKRKELGKPQFGMRFTLAVKIFTEERARMETFANEARSKCLPVGVNFPYNDSIARLVQKLGHDDLGFDRVADLGFYMEELAITAAARFEDYSLELAKLKEIKQKRATITPEEFRRIVCQNTPDRQDETRNCLEELAFQFGLRSTDDANSPMSKAMFLERLSTELAKATIANLTYMEEALKNFLPVRERILEEKARGVIPAASNKLRADVLDFANQTYVENHEIICLYEKASGRDCR